MAFTVIFPSTAPPPAVDAVEEWLTEAGEAWEPEGAHGLALRALPMRLVLDPEQPMLAHIQVTADVPLERLVNLLFALSVRSGSDVCLAGTGELSRADLWLRLAEDQDRQRMAGALERANERGNAEVHHRLWALLSASRPGRDLRWDVERRQVVELLEVGADAPGVEAARWHAEDPKEGDVVAVPVADGVHTLAWRWLSEAYPGLTE